jgi:very-short-patch-repair endonuclease
MSWTPKVPGKKQKRFSIHARNSPKYREKLAFARNMRHNPTPSEKALWKLLHQRPWGICFRRQVIILGWIADFYCPCRKLIIEVDGAYHSTPHQIRVDAYRDRVMTEYGFQVIRLSASRVLQSPKEALEEIRGRISPPEQMPGCRSIRAAGGFTGKRSPTEHAVSMANPRRGMISRAPEASAS